MTVPVPFLRLLCIRTVAAAAARRPAVVRAGVAWALVLTAVAGAEAGIPAAIRRHDITAIERAHAIDRDGIVRIRVRAFGRALDLELEPSPTLAADAQTITVDSKGSHRQASSPVLYRGRLADDAASTVRVALTGSSMIGRVSSAGETWFFEPLRRFEKGARADRTIVYRASDIDVSAIPPGTCAATATAGIAAPAGQAAPADIADAGEEETVDWTTDPAALAAAVANPDVVQLTLVADSLFYASHGSDSAAYMLSIVDQVAAFYPASLGVTASVVQTVIYQTAGAEPLTTSTSSTSLLTSLAQARASQPDILGQGDVTQLFTGRDLDGSTIGIAYLGTVCNRTYAASVAQDFSSSLHMMTLLVGHELGHTLGSHHDGQSGSPCSATGSGYVMWPSISSSIAEEFSACSRTSIAPVVDAATCLTGSTTSSCGNGVLESGEDCDDGGNAGGDCCRSDCRFDLSGSLCADDGNECTGDVCNGGGLCTHPNNTAPCHDGDACTFDSQCSNGTCVRTEAVEPVLEPRLKARLRSGSNNDMLLVSGLVNGVLASAPTVSGAVLRILDQSGGVLHESPAPAAGWIERKGAVHSFRFTPDAALVPLTGGLTSMVVRFRPLDSSIKVKAKISGIDLPFVESRGTVGVQFLIGDAFAGDCGTTLALTCSATSQTLSCW